MFRKTITDSASDAQQMATAGNRSLSAYLRPGRCQFVGCNGKLEIAGTRRPSMHSWEIILAFFHGWHRACREHVDPK